MFKPKIKVDIINEAGLKTKNYVIEGNQIIIKATKRGRGGAGYKVTFDKNCLLPYYVRYIRVLPFKQLKQKLMLIEGADKCVSFHFIKKGIKTPLWDRKTEENLFKASVIKAAGASTQKITVPTILYVLIFMTFAIGLINFMTVRGMLNF